MVTFIVFANLFHWIRSRTVKIRIYHPLNFSNPGIHRIQWNVFGPSLRESWGPQLRMWARNISKRALRICGRYSFRRCSFRSNFLSSSLRISFLPDHWYLSALKYHIFLGANTGASDIGKTSSERRNIFPLEFFQGRYFSWKEKRIPQKIFLGLFLEITSEIIPGWRKFPGNYVWCNFLWEVLYGKMEKFSYRRERG